MSDGYKVKDRSTKLAKRRRAMPINGKSVFTIVRINIKKAEAVKQQEGKR